MTMNTRPCQAIHLSVYSGKCNVFLYEISNPQSNVVCSTIKGHRKSSTKVELYLVRLKYRIFGRPLMAYNKTIILYGRCTVSTVCHSGVGSLHDSPTKLDQYTGRIAVCTASCEISVRKHSCECTGPAL